MFKSDGDSLTEISDEGFNFYQAWNAQGDSIYWQSSENAGVPYFLLKRGLYDNTVDTIAEGYTRYTDISPENVMISQVFSNSSPYISSAPLSDIEFNEEFALQTSNLGGLVWNPDGWHIYFTLRHAGLAKYNIQTAAFEILKESCSGRRYEAVTCSADGTKLLAQQVNSCYGSRDDGSTNYSQIVEQSSIVEIDLCTLEECVILE